MAADTVSDDDVVRNAEAAVAEIRAHIDHQVRAADSLDTRAGAMITALGVAASIIPGHLVLGDPGKLVGAVLMMGAGAVAIVTSVGTIAPRDAFSYGADVQEVAGDLRSPRTETSIALARSLADARDANASRLESKAGWFRASLCAVLALLVGAAYLAAVGGLR